MVVSLAGRQNVKIVPFDVVTVSPNIEFPANYKHKYIAHDERNDVI